MRIFGTWVQPDGQTPLPALRVKITAQSGELVEVQLAIDTGAENTVLSAPLVRGLGLAGVPSVVGLAGVGGVVPALVISPTFHFMKDDGSLFRANVQCFAFATDTPLNASVLGRDVLNLFSVVLDFPEKVVCLLTGNHRYVIQES